MLFKKDVKGQGAIEYLLMIAGAVVVAVVVIVLIQGMAVSGESQALDAQYNAQVETSKIGATVMSSGTTVPDLCGGSVIGSGVILLANTTIPDKTYFPTNSIVPTLSTGTFKYNGITYAAGTQLTGSAILDESIEIGSDYTLTYDMLVPQGKKISGNIGPGSSGATIWKKGITC